MHSYIYLLLQISFRQNVYLIFQKNAEPFDLLGFSRHEAHTLHMPPLRKHIASPNLFHLISLLPQHLHIAGECRRVAADINNLFGVHRNNGIQKFRIAPLTRRVDDNDVGERAICAFF